MADWLDSGYHIYWLVVSNIFYFSIYQEKYSEPTFIFLRVVQTTNQYIYICICMYIHIHRIYIYIHTVCIYIVYIHVHIVYCIQHVYIYIHITYIYTMYASGCLVCRCPKPLLWVFGVFEVGGWVVFLCLQRAWHCECVRTHTHRQVG